MRPDGELERFDEIGSIRDLSSRSPSAYGRSQGSLDLDGGLALIGRAIRDYESYSYQHKTDPWIHAFPFSRDLNEGMKIYNVSKNKEVLTVERVYDDPMTQRKSKIVRLSGGHPPERSDRLRLEIDGSVRYHHAYPMDIADTQGKDSSATEVEREEAWFDTITYKAIRQEPGTAGRTAFSRPKMVRPRFQETYTDPFDNRRSIQVSRQTFDALVQFDCWGTTSDEAVDLLRWFTQMMTQYLRIFRLNGFVDIRHHRRVSDAVSGRWRNDIYSSSVIYYMRTEDRWIDVYQNLTRTALNLALVPTGQADPPVLDESPPPTGTLTEFQQN